ncbi:MAG: integral rane protein [Pseudonocardiales bacterium]|nr:integral rane protein [Pseudonocardiales bacterium]
MAVATQAKRGRVIDGVNPYWLKVPGLIAPVALIGAWMIGGIVQPPPYSSISATISDLAATNARLPWIMTSGFVVTGLCLIAIAIGLRAVATAGRAAIAVGGVGVLLVAAFPLPAGGLAHTGAAALALGGLAVWPSLGLRSRGYPGDISPSRARTATWAGLALLVWFAIAPESTGINGLVERLLASGEILWITLVVVRTTGGRT